MSEDFEPSEIEALKRVAKERMAYDTITQKLKSAWIWAVAVGVISVWALSDKIYALLHGVK